MTQTSNTSMRRFSVAPMLDWTDRHERYFLRLISRRALLYTEMVTTGAMLHGDRSRFLDYHDTEHPVALQIGGSDPEAMARCAELAERWQYDEVNINVGCPSDRVQNGMFGACLMASPSTVADSVRAMKAATDLPVTVKHRIGIDDQDDYKDLENFVLEVAEAGCQTFMVHARKAWLKGLSPKENRDVPPLNYDRVYRLKQEHPELEIIINGGIKTLEECDGHLRRLDGVMLGREVYHNPYILAEVDTRLYGDEQGASTREDIVASLKPYIEQHLAAGGRLHQITRHIHGLFHGLPGARLWRRHLSEAGNRRGADFSVVAEALAKVQAARQPPLETGNHTVAPLS
ncbi:MAG: tRNA dihydrouridine(20/20a) synthase DusA [bacterium]